MSRDKVSATVNDALNRYWYQSKEWTPISEAVYEYMHGRVTLLPGRFIYEGKFGKWSGTINAGDIEEMGETKGETE
jgi:hypothetical protein